LVVGTGISEPGKIPLSIALWNAIGSNTQITAQSSMQTNNRRRLKNATAFSALRWFTVDAKEFAITV
jgi:hypothetical protein